MKKKILRNVFLTLFFAGIYIIQASAVTAYPEPVKFKQPDGTTITIQLKGDERVRWAQTLDGYSILLNENGAYEYAISNKDGGMTLSGIKVSDVSKRTKAENDLLLKTPKGLTYSDSQIAMMKSIWDIKKAESAKAFPTTGNRKLICILMGFKDRSFTKSQSEFNNLFNQVNYSTGGATGSVKDFYSESSYGQLNLTVTVAGPYTSNYNMSYYGGGNPDANPRALVTEAINNADPYVNFADYDNDNDGAVDGIYVIYAGYGEEAGASSDAIWAHAWSINTVYKDGVSISRYSCSAELRGNSGSTITTIGVICHEFGHVLGAPDYYDTNYSTGGQFDGTGKWDMMASGSWNNGGVTPAQHNAYTKVYVYNWANATTLSSGANVTVTNSIENKSFYRINSTTSGEYWVMENRQQMGFDAAIPGHGLIIYHVHSQIGSAGNQINATYPQKMYPVCASATTNPGSTASTYGTINSGGCPFPGTSSKTSFTDNTTPNMKSWAGANTNKPITNIAENTSTKTITFTFNGGGGTDTEAPTAPTNLTSSNLASTSVTLNWNASSDNVGVTGYNVYRNGSLFGDVTGTNANVTGLTANTTYSFYVKAFDAAGNISNASNTISVTTPPNGGDYCASSGDDYSYEWISKVQLNSESKSSNASGYSNFTSTTFNLSTGSNSVTLTPGFSGSSYNESWKIWIDFNGDKDFEDAGEQVFSQSGSSAVSGTITIPTSASGQTRMRVSMRYNNAPSPCGSFDYGEVEDYTVSFSGSGDDTQPPTAPTNLATTTITETSIGLSWTASTDNVAVTEYDVYQDGSSIGSVTGTTANVTGLTANTSYSFYVKAKDAAGNVSNASNTITATTSGGQVDYCTSKGNNSSYFWIKYVGLNNMTNTSGNDGGYGNYTNKTANLSPGSNYTLYLQTGYSGYTYTVYWAIWIDYNQNGTFESSERILNGSTATTSQVSGSFTVPTSALTGNTRIRISMKYGSEAGPCETFSYGEVEDYTIGISQQAPISYVAGNSDATELGFVNKDIFKIYPNPVKNTLHAEVNAAPESTINIISVTGALIKSVKVTSNVMDIDVSELTPGIYLFRYDNKQGKTKAERFIKE